MDLFMEALAAEPLCAQYIRDLLMCPEKVEHLKRRVPLVEHDFIAIALIDISGYSKLVSRLTSLGKVSSELITSSVNEFICNIINVIYENDGDVVRFLGDAVLAAWSGNRSTEQAAFSNAVQCCCRILSRHPTMSIEGQTLRLHVAVTASPGLHVILGDITDRLDYVVWTESLSRLGTILDEVKPGEIGIDYESFKGAGLPDHGIACRKHAGGLIFSEHEMQSLVSLLESQIFPSSRKAVRAINDELMDMELLACFANQSLLFKLARQNNRPNTHKESISHETMGGRTDSHPQFRPSSRQEETLAPALRVLSLSSSSVASRKMGVTSEFRRVAVLFVKLNFEFEPDVGQRALQFLLQALRAFGGTFQQYALDDKGQTMLACFGLPPTMSNNISLSAIKAARAFLTQAKKHGVGPVKVAIATGDLLFSKLGNQLRSEASLLGDVVNIAARLLGIPADLDCILINDEANAECGDLVGSKRLGDFVVKGKTQAIAVHCVSVSDDGRIEKASVTKCWVGYADEFAGISSGISRWSASTHASLTIVEAQSGFGKSGLIERISAFLSSYGIVPCMVRGEEQKMWTPFDAIQAVMTHIYRAIIAIITDTQLNEMNRFSGHRISRISRDTLRGSTVSGFATSSDVRHFLQYLGEPSESKILLCALVPSLQASPSTSPQTLANVSKERIAAFAERVIQKYSLITRGVFIFDDAQWFDGNSLELIDTMTRVLTKSMMLIFTRPLSGVKHSDVLEKLSKTPGTTVHVLKGLTVPDISEMCRDKFEVRGALRTDPEFAKAIHECSSGSPLVADLLLQTIFLKPDAIVISNGEVSLNKKCVWLHKILSGSAAATITAQFDELDAAFQEVLGFASTLGQYFSLRELVDIFGAEQEETDIHELTELILRSDRYGFLRRDDHGQGRGDHLYYFRHVTIMTTIYEGLSFADRNQMHLRAARFFEAPVAGKLNPEDFDDLDVSILSKLPLISHHYSRTDEVSKHLEYSEKLLCLNLFGSNHREAVHVGSELIKFFVTFKQSSAYQKLDAATKEDLDRPDRMFLWNGILSHSNTELRRHQDARAAGVRALEAVGIKWPTTTLSTVRSVLKEGFRLYWLYQRTRGGSIPLRNLRQEKWEINFRMRIGLLCFVYGFSHLFFFDKEFTALHAMLTFMLGLNKAILYAHDRPVNLVNVSVGFAMALQPVLASVSDTFVENAFKFMTPRFKFNRYSYRYAANLFDVKMDRAKSQLLYEGYMKFVEARGDMVNGRGAACQLSLGELEMGEVMKPQIEMLKDVDGGTDLDPRIKELLYICVISMLLSCSHERVAELISIMEASFETVQSAKSYSTSVTSFLRSWEALDIAKDVRLAVNRFNSYATYAQGIDQIGNPAVYCLNHASAYLWLLLANEQVLALVELNGRGASKARRSCKVGVFVCDVTKNDLDGLKSSVMALAKRCGSLSPNMPFVRPAMIMFEGALEFMDGNWEKGSRRMLKKWDKLQKYLAPQGTVLARDYALFDAIIKLLSSWHGPETQKPLHQEARDRLSCFGAKRWVESIYY